MADLIRFARLNQYINRFVGFIPLYWSNSSYHFEVGKMNTFMYKSLLLKMVIIVATLLILIFAPSLTIVQHIGGVFLVAGTIFIGLFIDLLVWQHGELVAIATNFLLEKHSLLGSNEHTRRSLKIKSVILTGLLLGMMFMTVVFGILLTSFEMDPLGRFLTFTAPALRDYMLMSLVRYIISIGMFQYMALPIRALIVCAVIGDILRFEILDMLSSYPMSPREFLLYNQLQIVSLLTVPYEMLGSAQVLLGEGGIIVVGVACVIVCLKLGYGFVVWLMVPAIVMTFGIVQVIISVCTVLYSLSDKIIETWRCLANQALGYKKQYYTRRVLGLKPICVPVGNIGVFDDEIRKNYTDKLIGYCVDVTLALGEILK